MSEKISFTTTKLQQLKSKSKRYTIADTKTPHLVLLVHPKGSKTFCYYGRIESKNPVYKTIGRFPEISVDEARQEAIKIQDTINQKKNPLKNSKIDKMYFSQCYESFMAQKEALLAEGTINDYKLNWKNHLEPLLAYKKVYQIDPDILQDLHLKMKKTPYQANRVIILVKSIFNFLIKKKGYLGANPATAVELYEEKPKNVILTPDEIAKLLNAMSVKENDNSFLWNTAILFLLLFSARTSNVLEMKWSEIDLDNSQWSVPKTKNGDAKIYTIRPIIMPFFEELKKYKIEGNDYVFPSKKSRAGHIYEVRKHFNKLLKEIGVERHIRVHDLRHTYGTMSALMNHSPSIIQTELGHRTLNASSRYINLANQMIVSYRDETIGKILSGISPSVPFLDHNKQPIFNDESIGGQIASNMSKTKLDLITTPVSSNGIEKMYREKRQAEKEGRKPIFQNKQK